LGRRVFFDSLMGQRMTELLYATLAEQCIASVTLTARRVEPS